MGHFVPWRGLHYIVECIVSEGQIANSPLKIKTNNLIHPFQKVSMVRETDNCDFYYSLRQETELSGGEPVHTLNGDDRKQTKNTCTCMFVC